MTNSESILNLLRRAQERRRTNHIFRELGVALCLSLPVPLLFKLWDLWSPVRGRTVAIVLGLWALAAAAVIAWRLRGGQSNLSDEAAAIDQRAGLNDELKTAFWFTKDSRKSEWIDAQLRRASETAARLNIDKVYPRIIPNVLYIAAGLFVALAVMNFLPLPGNHNWLLLDAAPAFSLSDEQRELIDQAQTLLQQAERLGEPEIVQRLQRIVQDLQEGRITMDEALAQLQELKTELEAGNLDIGNVREGLEEVANDLARSQTLEAAAQALSENDLTQAAEEFREAAAQVNQMTPEQVQEMQQALEQAAENERAGLEDLTTQFEEAAAALEEGNTKLTEEELKQIAEQIEQLMKEMQAQGLKNEAADALESLEEALREDGGDDGPIEDGDLQAAKPGEKGGDKAGKKAPVPPGQSAEGGGGQNPSGQVPEAPAPREGLPTQLDVILEQQELAPLELEEEAEKIEEQSKQDRSKLNYRNVTTELTPAQKDALNQTSIPWEYRQLIKQYFDAIRPPANK